MNPIKFTLWMVGFLLLTPLCYAQDAMPVVDNSAQGQQVSQEAYDPLIPQLFAFDKTLQIFAGINNVDNSIDIISYNNGVLNRTQRFLVDQFERRHDVHHIYRPQGIAIYDGYIVFLATHRDSCYFAVLSTNGELVSKVVFRGHASAFSYSPSAQELYIAGESPEGYDVIAVNVSNGFDNIDMTNAPSEHYVRPKKSEEVKIKDPFGVGMTLIAVSVVFIALALLFLAFKFVGKSLVRFQNKRARAHAVVSADATGAVSTALPKKMEDLTGEEFAAIATAIHLYYNELHDVENTILTIDKVTRNYSPWSSKIYAMNSYFNQKR